LTPKSMHYLIYLFIYFWGKAPALLPQGVPQLQPWELGGSLELSLHNTGGIWFKTLLPVVGANTALMLQRLGVWGSLQSSFAPGIPTKPPGSLLPDIGKVAHPLGWGWALYWAAPKGFYVPRRLTLRRPEPRRDGHCRAACPSLAVGSTQHEQASAPGVDPTSMGDGHCYGTTGRGTNIGPKRPNIMSLWGPVTLTPGFSITGRNTPGLLGELRGLLIVAVCLRLTIIGRNAPKAPRGSGGSLIIAGEYSYPWGSADTHWV